MDAERISRAERRESWMLWVGVLTGPAAWSLQLMINYNLEEIACGPAAGTRGEVWGIGVGTWILAVDVVLAIATLAAVLVAFRCLRTTADDTSTGNRARWMAVAGVMTSGLFLIVIVSGLAPPFILDVCETTP
jgi:heme/copper-type cytochrome/quinol oxidase subunit 2